MTVKESFETWFHSLNMFNKHETGTFDEDGLRELLFRSYIAGRKKTLEEILKVLYHYDEEEENIMKHIDTELKKIENNS